MPKLGMEPLRRQQLIDATLEAIAANGMRNTTMVIIARLAGLSPGIISHYFGSKQEVIEAAVRHLLDKLKYEVVNHHVGHRQMTPLERLDVIIESNFAGFHQSVRARRAWLAFWAEALHDRRLARLQQVNKRRLYSNLLWSLEQLVDDRLQAERLARTVAALIDGFWLRNTLSPPSEEEYREDKELCKRFIRQQIQQQVNLVSAPIGDKRA